MRSSDVYSELLSKVELFSDKVGSANSGTMSCKPGCDRCCRNTFTVFAVEAANIRLGFEGLPEGVKVRIKSCSLNAASDNICPLLHNGVCSLYGYRPVICRTHGLPLVSEHVLVDGRRVTTACEMNFPDITGLSEVPPEYVLDLDRLNATLTAINMLFMKENPGIEERVPLHRLFD